MEDDVEVYFPADAITYEAKPGVKAGNDVLDIVSDEIRFDLMYRLELVRHLEEVLERTPKRVELPEKKEMEPVGFRNN